MARVLVLFVVLLLPGTALAVWPVSWELGGQKHFFGPLVSYEEEDSKTHLTIRPLLFSYDSPRTYSFLYPLGASTEEKAYLVPLYMRQKWQDGENTAIFPVFWGRTGERSYGGVFPFYGKLYNRFRRDEIGFIAWPFYSYSTWEGTTRTNVAWPFFSFYSGYQEGYKIGPLYGHRKWGNERESWFFLLPFFVKEKRDLDTDNPKDSLWAIPFYVRTTSPKSAYYSVLWPFFSYYRLEDRTDVNAPWPFFSYSTGQEEKAFSLWPVYSHQKSNRDEVTYVMWPVYKKAERFTADKRWVEYRILLINRHMKDNRGAFFNIWPFFEYRAADESTSFFFPSVFPVRLAGYDRIVRPLLTVYAYEREGQTRTTNLLYGLYTKEQKGDTWRRRFAFIAEVKKDADGYGFEVLSGLFGIDPNRIKLFFFSLGRRK